MIVLNTTSDTLKISLGSTPSSPLQCYVSFRDRSSTTFSAGRSTTSVSSSSDTTITSAPSSGSQRVIDFISIYNPNSSAINTTLKIDSGGSQRIVFNDPLSQGETAQYQEGQGFYVLHSLGAKKKSTIQLVPPNKGIEFVIPSQQISMSGTTPVLVPGLGFTADSGKTYYFRAICGYTVDALTTGARFSVTGPANPTILGYRSFHSASPMVTSGTSPTSAQTNTYLSLYNDGSTSGSSGTTGGNLAFIEGMIRTSSTGFVQITFQRGAGGTATTLTSSVLYYNQTSL